MSGLSKYAQSGSKLNPRQVSALSRSPVRESWEQQSQAVEAEHIQARILQFLFAYGKLQGNIDEQDFDYKTSAAVSEDDTLTVHPEECDISFG